MCSSPRLIAACHDILRLLMPRHSPCALYSLTDWHISCLSHSRDLVLTRIMQASDSVTIVVCVTHFMIPQSLLCYLSAACSQFLACFTVQFSRCSSNLTQGQIEMLRHSPKHFNPISMVEVTGLEPVTPCLQSRCSTS